MKCLSAVLFLLGFASSASAQFQNSPVSAQSRLSCEGNDVANTGRFRFELNVRGGEMITANFDDDEEMDFRSRRDSVYSDMSIGHVMVVQQRSYQESKTNYQGAHCQRRGAEFECFADYDGMGRQSFSLYVDAQTMSARGMARAPQIGTVKFRGSDLRCQLK